ncbi:MAG: hypothetical protein H0W42_11200 [Gemmatimonadaceae bacterium]|nr:hypothetical protein [Gemmatimonadaceae bacterium]
MAKSNYERDLYLNSRFRDAGALAALGTVYLALHSADPTAADLANELPIGTGGYARLAIGTTNSDWTAPATNGTKREITNASTLTGGTASADLNGGAVIPFYSLRDAATAGNMIRHGGFDTARAILNGDVISFPPGAVSIGET